MRFVIHHKSGFSLIALLLLGISISFFHSSCEGEEECFAPTIDSLTFRDSLSRIDYLVPGRVVTLHGEHLDKTTGVVINKTSLDATYMLIYEQSITFLVPGVETNDPETDLSDSIRIIKSCGEALFQVNILNAPPYIEKIDNEYAIAGDTLGLSGRNFALLETVTFPGNLQGEILTDYTDTTCRVIVPGGVLNEGEIVLHSKSGDGTSAFGIEYRDRSGLICNFDDLDTWESWGGQVIASGTDPAITSCNGYFFLAEADDIEPATEEVESTVLPIAINKSLPYAGNLTPDYFAIKCEMFFKEPWTTGTFRIEIGKRDEAENIEYAYEYFLLPDELETVFTSQGSTHWITRTIPLEGFTLVGSPNIPLQSYAQLRVMNYMRWGFVNPLDENDGGGSTIDKVGIAIDNIRISQVVEEGSE